MTRIASIPIQLRGIARQKLFRTTAAINSRPYHTSQPRLDSTVSSPSAAHLKPNDYASSFIVSDADLPPLESQDSITFDDDRIVFLSSGILLFRGEQYTAISHQRLRDHCECPRCLDPSTRQKLHTSGSVAGARLAKTIKGFDASGASGIHVTWADSHTSFYSLPFLIDMVSYNTSKTNVNHHHKRVFWDRTILEASNLRMRYDDLDLAAMLRQVQVYGLVIITGVPTERTSDRDCELRAFMSRIGEIRNTFYGQTWDVKSVVNSKNVAYTSQDLGLHMDLLYFSSPPRFQALHCLRNRVEGGSSYFADAFHAARHLQRTDQVTSNNLARNPVVFEYDNDGHYLTCRHFVMNHLDSLRSHINWSPPFQGKTRVASPRYSTTQTLKVEKEHYEALAKFEAALERPGAQYEFTMEEGDLIFFDNRRVLHARRSFGPGERWLKGCYLDGEVVWDKLATMH